ncbi:MAG: hypothetical protein FWF82_02755, partial [Oscillospiraceae bacterium]|nr:hypothetical protein [Oscillospiraceae bacterium]
MNNYKRIKGLLVKTLRSSALKNTVAYSLIAVGVIFAFVISSLSMGWKQPSLVVTGGDSPDIPYISASGATWYLEEEELSGRINSDGGAITLTSGWYLVEKTDLPIIQSGTVAVDGDVHIVLEDGCRWEITGSDGYAGISVVKGVGSLTIYSQSSDSESGVLDVTAGSKSAGIGGNTGDKGRDSGLITINGGKITARGDIQKGFSKNGVMDMGGAGIGGGGVDPTTSTWIGGSGNVLINGGTVIAFGGNNAAGIGSGCGNGRTDNQNKTEVVINGGDITAVGGGYCVIEDDSPLYTAVSDNISADCEHYQDTDVIGTFLVKTYNIEGVGKLYPADVGTYRGAGIGGGGNHWVSGAVSVKINGDAKVRAFGGRWSAGLGTLNHYSLNIEIGGNSDVTAYGGYLGAGIGGGRSRSGGRINISGNASVFAKGGASYDGGSGAGIGGGGAVIGGFAYQKGTIDSVEYAVDGNYRNGGNGGIITIS